MAKKSVKIINEVQLKPDERDYTLTFQKCTFTYDDGDLILDGFRFMWRRPNGRLQTARGQARIPSPEELFTLLHLASEAGWFPKPSQWASLISKNSN